MTTQLGEHQFINLGRLPKGQYAYHFTVLNAFKQEFEIRAAVHPESNDMFVIRGDSEKKRFHIVFDTHSDADTTLSFQLTKGNFVFVKPAICPQLHSDEQHSLSNSLMPGMVNSFFVEDQQKRQNIAGSLLPIDIYARVFKEVQLYNDAASNNGSFKWREPFYDFIDLETSRKQLDYVVFEKMLTEKKGNFFSRAIRKITRKLFVAVYRMVTRNPGRKDYLAKLYRNYVNMNNLSEREKA